MQRLLLCSALLLIGSPPSSAAAPVQRGQRTQQSQGAEQPSPSKSRPAKGGQAKGGRGAANSASNNAERAADRAEVESRDKIDVDLARVRMNTRLAWLIAELKLNANQRKRLRDLFELELWAGTARRVEPFPNEPDLTQPLPRTQLIKITRGELEDRQGLFSESPREAQVSQQAAEEAQTGRGGGRGGGRGDSSSSEPAPDPGIPPGLSPEAEQALRHYRAQEVEMVIRTTHPMLADLTASTLDGVIALLETAQTGPYLELLGDEGRFLVRAHAAQRISGFAMLESGVARITPVATKEWTVAKRKQTRRGRGRGRGGNGKQNGKNQRSRY